MSAVTLDLSPAPGAAPAARRGLAQSRLEWRLLMSNGEQLLLTVVIPVLALVLITRFDAVSLEEAVPGVMALAILSSTFTATAISTGFERRSGVLKLLGATPLHRSGLLVGKVVATLAVVLVQLVLIGVTAAILGWSASGVTLAELALAVALGTAALGSWGFALAGLLRAEATLAVANAIFLVLAVGGGTVLPTDRLPAPMDTLVGLLPSAALGDLLRGLLDPSAGGVPWSAPLVLLAWAVAGVLLASRTFRWE